MKAPTPFEGKLKKSAYDIIRLYKHQMPQYVGMDDLKQEAFIIYMRCAKKYPKYSAERFTAAVLLSVRNYMRSAKWNLRSSRESDITCIAPTINLALAAAGKGGRVVDAYEIAGEYQRPDEYSLIVMDATDEERKALRALEGANFELKRRKAYGKDGYEDATTALRRLSGVTISPSRLKELIVG